MGTSEEEVSPELSPACGTGVPPTWASGTRDISFTGRWSCAPPTSHQESRAWPWLPWEVATRRDTQDFLASVVVNLLHTVSGKLLCPTRSVCQAASGYREAVFLLPPVVGVGLICSGVSALALMLGLI